ncbi:hypothetical protein [Haliangium sp.]|uniref:hypothetical protein n=1 Tax=Haliangium sp. TaxID=2663208 RepID=UPI003D11424B
MNKPRRLELRVATACAAALLLLAVGACSDDSSGQSVADAAPGSDGSVPDAAPSTVDANPNQPDADPNAPDAGPKLSCGGIVGDICDDQSYCDYNRNQCGADDDIGLCQPRPEICQPVQERVCGCDGTVYANECGAEQAGVDIANEGGCTPPAGTFACGSRFCLEAAEYCEIQRADVAGEPDTFACKLMPSACGGTPSCACMTGEPCGADCSESGGNFTLVCPGG